MPKPLHVYLFNVGQGDHILIQLPNGEYGIIDSHYDAKYNPLNEPPGLTFLKERSKKESIRIAFLHISHYHKDHFKGLEQWLCWFNCEDIPLDRLWLPNVWESKNMIKMIQDLFDRSKQKPSILRFMQENSDYIDELIDLARDDARNPLYQLEKLRATPKKCRNFDLVYLDGQCVIEPLCKEIAQVGTYCLGPLKERTQNFQRLGLSEVLESLLAEKDAPTFDQNNVSNILIFRFGDFTLLFGGDAEKESIEECIDEFKKKNLDRTWGFDLACNFIKCFHHGSKSSTSPYIWTTLLKEDDSVIIAISAGDNKRYNHPNKQTIEELHEIAKRNNIELKLFTTKDHALLDLSPYELTDSDEIIRLPWPSLGGEVLEHRRDKNARLDAIEIRRNDKLEQFNAYLAQRPSNFLGYRFDFLSNKGEIEVKKMMAG